MSALLVKAWVDEAQADFLAGKVLLENKFFAQTVFLAQQCAAKALKALFILCEVGENTGLHPGQILEELVKKANVPELKAFETRVPRLVKSYKSLEIDAQSARFPRDVQGKIVCPTKEFASLHGVRALTVAREILGMIEEILKKRAI